MSTFKGIVAEFPDIRIDFFRKSSDHPPPLACFLSHVHSDHLAGLDTLKSPFIYCSPATREILLRLETYPHRMNFALQILESRKLTYKHLDKLLKPIPLETPTKIELTPGKFITVTLFDANHCPGAVMFLIENDKHSILYTGDLRSEPSFVTNLHRNPHLIEYTSGVKTLDCIYLDTSNTENISFPSKTDGLRELIGKVSKYPQDTVFHMTAWTYGYEEVWIALSKALESQIHVDRYKMRIYKSLVGSSSGGGPSIASEGPILTGYQCGNSKQDGCLTENPDVRIHSCENGLYCPTVLNNPKVVWITPIITRTFSGVIEEVGIGGGGGDLTQRPQLELGSAADIEAFLNLLEGLDDGTEEKLRERLLAVLHSSRMVISLDDLGLRGLDRDQNEMSLNNFADLISKSASKTTVIKKFAAPKDSLELPRKITFPYSRHSSFPELCDFVAAFKPKDVYPCTVDESEWHEGLSIRALFGRHCSNTKFRHDMEMRKLQAQKPARAASIQTHTTESSKESDDPERSSSMPDRSRASPELGKGGRLRPYQHDRNGLDGPNSAGRQHESPPQEIVSKSPGSQSQSLRRKLILQDLAEARHAKRAKLTRADGPPSSPLDSKTAIESTDSPKNLDAAASSDAEGQSDSDQGDPEEWSDEDETFVDCNTEVQRDYLETWTFFDSEDQVQRCLSCQHELQSLMGMCEHCEEDAEPPYLEVCDPELGPRAGYVFTDIDKECMQEDDRLEYVGDYLDAESSAYDSFDEDDDLQEEYEVNSFIDDTSGKSESDEEEEIDPEAEDVDIDWEARFMKLEGEHDALRKRHTDLSNTHDVVIGALIETEEKYHSLLDELGIPHSNEDDDEMHDEMLDDMDEEMDDEGNILVGNPVPPIPAVHELVLPLAQDDDSESQNSDEEGRRQREKSLKKMLEEHNHTEPEIEL